MENESSPYQAVRVDMIGVESGLERFSKDGHLLLPPVAHFRNNLTALSQNENLFFVASDDHIAVYEPEFPYQTLRRQPSLLFIPELSNCDARGYLSQRRDGVRDPAQDHCVNHLKVGDLGTQEILVLATDSGNVVAYYTNSILEAVRRASGRSNQGSGSALSDPRPFFSYWLRQSAWGIDIHTAARMIAVSVNVPNAAQPPIDEDSSAKITVFAFGLSAPTPHPPILDSDDMLLEAEDDIDWVEWCQEHNSDNPDRNRNYKITLGRWNGHNDNVPNISFVNCSEDSEGSWILSTDIQGEMMFWQIWKGYRYRKWDFGSPESNVRPFFNRPFPGWNVAALDIKSFRATGSIEEFVGTNKPPIYYGYHDTGRSFNISGAVNRLQGNSQFHPSHTELTDIDPPEEPDQLFNDFDEESDEGEPLNQDMMDHVNSPPGALAMDYPERSGMNTTGRYDHLVHLELQSDTESDIDDEAEDDVDEDSEDAMPELLAYNPRLQRLMRRQVTQITNHNIQPPNVALLHCSDAHIRMLRCPKANYPHVFCSNILKQIPPEDAHTHLQGVEFIHHDRLNMLHTISELGIVLIATGTGRVAVCALTRHPNENLLGLRVDCVLPLKRQERSGIRPNLCTLIGIATGPVQGRWKIIPDNVEIEQVSAFEDGEVDGIRTTFDPSVVVLSNTPTHHERQLWEKGECKCRWGKKLTKNAHPGCTGLPPRPVIEQRPWSSEPPGPEPRQSMENHRRYRVMLTYSDMSVITYEISRDVVKREVA